MKVLAWAETLRWQVYGREERGRGGDLCELFFTGRCVGPSLSGHHIGYFISSSRSRGVEESRVMKERRRGRKEGGRVRLAAPSPQKSLTGILFIEEINARVDKPWN